MVLTDLLPLFPIPAPAGTPPWVGIVFVLMALSGFAVLLWRVVQYFRNDDDSES